MICTPKPDKDVQSPSQIVNGIGKQNEPENKELQVRHNVDTSDSQCWYTNSGPAVYFTAYMFYKVMCLWNIFLIGEIFIFYI